MSDNAPDKLRYILYYEDTDIDIEIINGEKSAKERYAQVIERWAVHLFRQIPHVGWKLVDDHHEYILKSTADKEKQGVVHGMNYNVDERVEQGYQEGLAKGRDEHEETLKPIRDAIQAWNDFQSGKLDYLDSSTPWKACKETLELADKAGK